MFSYGHRQNSFRPPLPPSNGHFGVLFGTLFFHIFLTLPKWAKECKKHHDKCSDPTPSPPKKEKAFLDVQKKGSKTIQAILWRHPPPWQTMLIYVFLVVFYIYFIYASTAEDDYYSWYLDVFWQPFLRVRKAWVAGKHCYPKFANHGLAVGPE